MPTYLLQWDPHSAFKWPNNAANSAATRRGDIVHIRWSTGGTSRIVLGDRIFLGKLGQAPIGVIASGVAASDCFEDTHWEDDSKRTIYNMVDFDTILDPEKVLPRSRLADGALGRVNWDVKYGGATIAEEAAGALEAKWREWVGSLGFPRIESELEQSVFRRFGYAGWTKLRLHLSIERDPNRLHAKREDALKRSGKLECDLCRVAFTDGSAGVGAGSIECHDRRPLSALESTGDRNTSIHDLALVCANCHRMLHLQDSPQFEQP